MSVGSVESASERYVGEVITKILEVYKDVDLTCSRAEFLTLPCKNVFKCVQLLWRLESVNQHSWNGKRWGEKYHGQRDAYVLDIIGNEVRPLLAAAVADNGLANALLQSKIVALRAFVETGWSDVVAASVESVQGEAETAANQHFTVSPNANYKPSQGDTGLSMTCESDGGIQSMLALLRVEGLGADTDKPVAADKPARLGYYARAGGYMKGIDAVTKEKKALEAEIEKLQEKFEKKVAELEADVALVTLERHNAAVARDRAQTQLSQLRADVAREKKEKEAKVAELEADVALVTLERQNAAVARDRAQTQLSQLRADVAREKKEKEAVKAKDDEQRRKAQEYTEAAKAKADEQRRKAQEYTEAAKAKADEQRQRAEADRKEWMRLHPETEEERTAREQRQRAEADRKEWMRLHPETEEERTARERKEWQEYNRIMDAHRY
jgi:hypothetical protein